MSDDASVSKNAERTMTEQVNKVLLSHQYLIAFQGSTEQINAKTQHAQFLNHVTHRNIPCFSLTKDYISSESELTPEYDEECDEERETDRGFSASACFLSFSFSFSFFSSLCSAFLSFCVLMSAFSSSTSFLSKKIFG